MGEAVVAAIIKAGGLASFFQADVTNSVQVKALVHAAIERHGKLDVMVNNAGRTHRNQPALDVSEDDFDKCYAINVKSIYLSTIHAVPHFKANGGGVFINIASTRCSTLKRVYQRSLRAGRWMSLAWPNLEAAFRWGAFQLRWTWPTRRCTRQATRQTLSVVCVLRWMGRAAFDGEMTVQ
jgi:enoyl-[acyl-carrier-protein] reductase (NADH)